MDKYEGLQKITDWIKNSSSEEFMETFNKLDKEYSGMTLGDFIDLTETEKETEDFSENKEDTEWDETEKAV